MDDELVVDNDEPDSTVTLVTVACSGSGGPVRVVAIIEATAVAILSKFVSLPLWRPFDLGRAMVTSALHILCRGPTRGIGHTESTTACRDNNARDCYVHTPIFAFPTMSFLKSLPLARRRRGRVW